MNETQKFKNFNELYGLKNKELTHEQAIITAQLIADELQEFLQEFYSIAKVAIIDVCRPVESPNIPNAAKELEDIRYITGQQMTECGMDVQGIGDEVHRSNMSKRLRGFSRDKHNKELEIAKERYPHAEIDVTGSGFVLKCKESGKVIKPTTYSQARITLEIIGK